MFYILYTVFSRRVSQNNVFYLVVLYRTFTIQRTGGKGERYFLNSSLPLSPALQTLRHWLDDYCRKLIGRVISNKILFAGKLSEMRVTPAQWWEVHIYFIFIHFNKINKNYKSWHMFSCLKRVSAVLRSRKSM